MTNPYPKNAAWLTGTTGPGWEPLIQRTNDRIEALFPGYQIWQVKEKFGGLRYYCDNSGEPEVAQIIREAEAESFRICEECGTLENVTSEGDWIKTLCPACRQERETKRNDYFKERK
jgi:hypothetical protein